MEHILTRNINLKITSDNNSYCWAEVIQKEHKITIPLLLTESESEKAIILLNKIDFSNYPIKYISMIVAGCFKVIISGIHL
jgi:hypothetical protein